MVRQLRNGVGAADGRSIVRADVVNGNGAGCRISGGRVSVVVPTRNEAGNVVELLHRVAHLPAGLLAEVIFVDDSDDDTPQLILDHAESCAFPIRVLHREPGERSGGLSSAVLAGWEAAIGEWLCVMDGDLQHPPEVITELRETAIRERRDLVCATRYGGGAQEHGLGIVRRQLSKTTTLAARLLFPRRLRHMSDPMSGFFVVRRASVDLDRLNPTGFKILLEVLLRFPRLRRREVPFEFSSRFTGQSKTSLREGLRYLRHLGRLRLGLTPQRAATVRAAWRFAAVGGTGIVVNELLLWIFVAGAGLGYVGSAVLATQGSTVWNFALADAWVFRRGRRGSLGHRFLIFAATNNAMLLLRVPVLALLVSGLGLHYLSANLVTLALLFAGRFLISDRLIWQREVAASSGSNTLPHRYNVAGIVTIASEIRLRELEWFRVAPGYAADIELRRGLVGSRKPRRRVEVELASGTVVYEEHLGALASNFSVDFSGPIRVTVGPLLATSPHVVYTNVIEALLRFVLVSRGYMLLHAATVELDDCGAMLSARTDTGKTGTILRLVREQRCGFLSDDMTIISPDGVACSYPKPLTISAHTLRAVDQRALSRRERVKLAVQSHIHSKSGRSFGTWLAAHNLPIMTLNALIQKIVPPPKYMVDRLVPCSIRHITSVANLFIIERGSPAMTEVGYEEAIDQLIENTDDAYGFPPFQYFAPAIAINGDGYTTLRAKERAILARALRGVRVRRLTSDTFSWADTIPRLAHGHPVTQPKARLVDLRNA